MWDLSSLIRDQTCGPALRVWSLNHWNHQRSPIKLSFKKKKKNVILKGSVPKPRQQPISSYLHWFGERLSKPTALSIGGKRDVGTGSKYRASENGRSLCKDPP